MSFELVYGVKSDLNAEAKEKSLDLSNVSIKNLKNAASLAATIGVSVFAAGAAAAFKAYKNYAELEKSQVKLNLIINRRGDASVGAAKRAAEFSQSMQGLSVFSKISINEAQTMLFKFKSLSEGEVQQAVKVSTDIATIMGTDVKGVAQALGKALQDPERGLQTLGRMGVRLTEGQQDYLKALAKTDLNAAQQAILQVAGKNFQGAAEAMTQGTGVFTALKNTMFDLSAEAGRALAPEFEIAIKGLTKIVNGFADAGETFKFIKAYLIGIFEATLKTFIEISGIDFSVLLSDKPTWKKAAILGFQFGKGGALLFVNTAKAIQSGAIQEIFDKNFEAATQRVLTADREYTERVDEIAKIQGRAELYRQQALEQAQTEQTNDYLQREEALLARRETIDFTQKQTEELTRLALDNSILEKQIALEEAQLQREEFETELTAEYLAEWQSEQNSLRLQLFKEKLIEEQKREQVIKQVRVAHAIELEKQRKADYADRFNQESQRWIFQNTLLDQFSTLATALNGDLSKAMLQMEEIKQDFLVFSSIVTMPDQGSADQVALGTKFANVESKRAQELATTDSTYKLKMLILTEKLIEAIAESIGFFAEINPMVWACVTYMAELTIEKFLADSALKGGPAFQFNEGFVGGLPSNWSVFMAAYSPRELALGQPQADLLREGRLALAREDFDIQSSEPVEMTIQVPDGLQQHLDINVARVYG